MSDYEAEEPVETEEELIPDEDSPAFEEHDPDDFDPDEEVPADDSESPYAREEGTEGTEAGEDPDNPEEEL